MNETFSHVLPLTARFQRRQFLFEQKTPDGDIGVFLKKARNRDIQLQAYFSAPLLSRQTVLAGICDVEETNDDSCNPATFLDYPIKGVFDVPLYMACMEVLAEFRGFGIASSLFAGMIGWLEEQYAIEVAAFSPMGKERMYHKYIGLGYQPIAVRNKAVERLFLQPGYTDWVYKAYNSCLK